MSDSLVLKGVKEVTKHKGDELNLLKSKRGASAYPVKKWWAQNATRSIYLGCSVFEFTQGGQTVYLAVHTADKTSVRIDTEEGFKVNFYSAFKVERAALFTRDWELIEHYVFPKISGGKIMTVTPANPAARPTVQS